MSVDSYRIRLQTQQRRLCSKDVTWNVLHLRMSSWNITRSKMSFVYLNLKNQFHCQAPVWEQIIKKIFEAKMFNLNKVLIQPTLQRCTDTFTAWNNEQVSLVLLQSVTDCKYKVIIHLFVYDSISLLQYHWNQALKPVAK